jgi:hypothetical protein
VTVLNVPTADLLKASNCFDQTRPLIRPYIIKVLLFFRHRINGYPHTMGGVAQIIAECP